MSSCRGCGKPVKRRNFKILWIVKMMALNPRRIVAVILLLLVAAMIFYPAFSKGTVRMRFVGNGVGSADHLYVTMGPIEVHDAALDNQTGWQKVSNQTVMLDLMNRKSLSEFTAKGTVQTGWYDMVSIHVVSASLCMGSNETVLALSSDQYAADISFVIKTSTEATVIIGFNFDVQEIARTSTLSLELEASISS
jgi:hypothetical protein